MRDPCFWFHAPSIVATAENAQQLPQEPWFFTGLTMFFVLRQSQEEGADLLASKVASASVCFLLPEALRWERYSSLLQSPKGPSTESVKECSL